MDDFTILYMSVFNKLKELTVFEDLNGSLLIGHDNRLSELIIWTNNDEIENVEFYFDNISTVPFEKIQKETENIYHLHLSDQSESILKQLLLTLS
ncbi:MAG: hypothetical protein DRG78_00290 [Epsilonproteobacteria bacterium]|nr:MAG: hypothetical protein DRG78_00290 [Campylobacterota bacterium]